MKKIRFKDLFKVVSKKNTDPNVVLLAATQSRGIIPKTDVGYRTVTIAEENFEGLKIVKKGNFCITLRSFQGGIEYSEYDGGISSGYTILQLKKKASEKYYKYFLKNQVFISTLNKYKVSIRDGQNIPFKSLGKEDILFPRIEQQTAIANFLDHQTSKIDKEISLLEEKVELLDELKQSTIYEAVTKGINPDVKMKDSGIEWIGIIPEHWEVKRLKSISNIKKGQIFNEEYSAEDGMYPYINGGISPSDYSNRYNTLENTIAVSEGGASAGYAQLMLTKYWAGTHCYKINTKYNVKYLYYIFKGYEKHLMSEKTGSAMPNLQKTRFINFCVSFSSDQQEQIRIVTFLEQKESTINKNKNLLIKKIELLKEYKQSIIFEAVTGKILTKEENESNTKR